MNANAWVRALAVWLVMMLAEVVHGTLRALLLVPLVGDFRARQIGVFTGSLLVLAIVWWLKNWIRAETSRALFAVGLAWVVLTLLFEVSLGRFVLAYPWERIASDYRVAQGGFMPFGLLVMTLAPLIAVTLGSRCRNTRFAASPVTP